MALSKRNLVVVLFVGFVNYLEWAVVMTTIYPYIDEYSSSSMVAVYLSLAQSLFPLGQGISQPIASLLVKRLCQIKIVLIGSIIIAIAGNVVYMLAAETKCVALIITGRAVAGFGAGSGGVAYGFIGANTSRENRTTYMSLYRVTCMFGVLFATISSATYLPNFQDNVLGKATGLTEYSSPAALTIACLVVALVMVTFVLNESDCVPIGDRESSGSIKASLKSRGVILGIMLFFLNGYITTWVGYVMPLVAYPIFKWDVDQFGWLMVGVSGTAALGSFATSFFSKTECMKTKGDWITLVVCYVFMTVGAVLSYVGGPTVLKNFSAHEKEGFFVAGVITVFLTYSVCGVILPTMTTKFVEKAMMPVIMPYCIASMSAGKVLAPLLSKAMQLIQGWDLLFISSAVLVAFGGFMFLFLYRAPEPEQEPLLPTQRNRKSTEDSIKYHSTEIDQSGKRLGRF